MKEGDTITEDQAERLIRELCLQLDMINDHLNGIERALSSMADNQPITEFRRDHSTAQDIRIRWDRP